MRAETRIRAAPAELVAEISRSIDEAVEPRLIMDEDAFRRFYERTADCSRRNCRLWMKRRRKAISFGLRPTCCGTVGDEAKMLSRRKQLRPPARNQTQNCKLICEELSSN